MTGHVVEASSVSVVYDSATGPVSALRDVEVVCGDGAITAVAGPSGSGKSSLLRVLAGVERPSAGTVVVDGIDITAASSRAVRRVQRHRLAYVFQEPSFNLISYMKVGRHPNLWRHLRGLPPVPPEPLLQAVGLIGQQAGRPVTLSGGEQQRLAFAAAVAARPAVVLADEPTSQLDPASAGLLIDALARLRDLGAAMVIASHDPDVLAVADRVVYLDHGSVVEGPQ